jgi:selenophosphate synthase
LSSEFWQRVIEYQNLGLNPVGWISNNSSEIDYFTINETIKDTKKSSSWVDLSWYDAFFYSGKNPEITRRIYGLGGHEPKEIINKRIVALLRVDSEKVSDSSSLSQVLSDFFSKDHNKFPLKKLAISTTSSNKESQFGLIDHIDVHRGDKVGYTAVNTSSARILDPLQKPDSEVNVEIAFTLALENLLLLGCTTGFKIIPIYDAPDDELLDQIRINNDTFSAKYNIAIDDYSSLKLGSLFYGATTYAHSTNELPVKYDLIEPGMAVILSDYFGSLTPLSINVLKQIDSNVVLNMEFADEAVKGEIIKSLSQPRFSLGKIISKYCPEFGNSFETGSHIISVFPVTTDGVIALLNLSEVSQVQMVIDEIPMKHEDMAIFATNEYLVSNATASTNGCHLIVSSDSVAELILEDLRKHNFRPTKIGRITAKGTPSVRIGRNISKYVAAKHIINKFDIINN